MAFLLALLPDPPHSARPARASARNFSASTRILLAVGLLLCPALARAQTAPQHWSLIEDLRIGSRDGPQSLTAVNALVVSPDRRYVYVGQRKENTIRVFDASSGDFIREIGREGAGPGEFRSLTYMGWRRDTLFAVDMSLQRVALFSEAGEHLRTERVESAIVGTGGHALPRAILADGTMIGSPLHSMGETIRGEITSVPWVQMTRDGKIIRTVAERDVTHENGMVTAGRRITMFIQPMSTTTLLSIAPDGSSLLIVDAAPSTENPARFRVTRMAPSGDTLYRGVYRYAPHVLAHAVADSIYEVYAKLLFPSLPSARAREMTESTVYLPPAIPPVSRAVLGPDGTAWLRREDLGEGTVEWLVLDPGGHIEATVQTPSALKLLTVASDEVWGTVRDELDIPFVVRYRVKRPGEG